LLNLQGRAELHRAKISDNTKELAAQARGTLAEAVTKLEAAETELNTRGKALPNPDSITDPKEKKKAAAVRHAMEGELGQTQLEIALNLYDRAQTYIAAGQDKAASELLQKCKTALTPLSLGEPTQPVTWKAMAWRGLVALETEDVDRAHAYFQQVIGAAGNPAAEEGNRLARYFRLYVMKTKPRVDDAKMTGKQGLNAYIIDRAKDWRKEYARHRATSEGSGVTYLLAKALIEESGKKGLPAAKATPLREEAVALLRELETGENEYTEEVRRLKITVMAAQGLFKNPIAKLKTFDQCYVRAQYETGEMNREMKEAKTDEEREAKRKERIGNILLALERGLAMPEVKKMKATPELNNARSMLAFWSLQIGKLEEAIKAGEAFVRDDPTSSQAEMAGFYAMQAYTQLITQKQGKAEDITEERERMFRLASTLENAGQRRWPATSPGTPSRCNCYGKKTSPRRSRNCRW